MFRRLQHIECISTEGASMLELGKLYSVQAVTPVGIKVYGHDRVFQELLFAPKLGDFRKEDFAGQ